MPQHFVADKTTLTGQRLKRAGRGASCGESRPAGPLRQATRSFPLNRAGGEIRIMKAFRAFPAPLKAIACRLSFSSCAHGPRASRRSGGPDDQYLPLAGRLQLPGMGRRRAGVQRRHLDAAHRPGLAGADRADQQQRHRGRHRDVAAVRPVAAAPAPDRLCRRPLRPPQGPAGDPVRHGPAGAGPGPADAAGRGAAVAGLPVRLPARLRQRLRRAGAPDLRLGTGGRRAPDQCGGAELHLVQRRPHDRPGGGGPSDRLGRHRLGIRDQCAVVCRCAGVAGHAAGGRAALARAGGRRAPTAGCWRACVMFGTGPT